MSLPETYVDSRTSRSSTLVKSILDPSIIPIIPLPLPERADGLDGQAVARVARDHYDLTTVMRLVGHEIGQYVRHVKREIPPYVTIRRRDGAICREPQLEESLDASAAPFQRGDELSGRHAVVIHASRSGDAMLTSQRLEPPASGIVKVRRNRANRTLRRAGNGDTPKRTRQTLDELYGDPVARAPGTQEARLPIVPLIKGQAMQLPLKELQIVLRNGIRVM